MKEKGRDEVRNVKREERGSGLSTLHHDQGSPKTPFIKRARGRSNHQAETTRGKDSRTGGGERGNVRNEVKPSSPLLSEFAGEYNPSTREL